VVVPQVHRIRIENFRRIQVPLELDLVAPKGEPSRTIVLAGPNGSGKTTVLEAILLGLGMESLIVRDLEKSKRAQRWRVTLEPGAKVELDVSVDGSPLQTWVRTSEKHVVRSAAGDEVPLSSFALESLAVELFSSWRAPELVGSIHPLGGGPRPRDNENNRLWRLKQRICDERARAGYTPMSASASKADVWLSRINEAWAEFHANDGTRIDARLDDTRTEDEGLLADLFVVRDDTMLYPVDQASSGEIELLSFAGAILLNDFKGGLLLIDEPELHLHPQCQATILPALRTLAPDVQMIVASHSDAVWDQAYSFERFLLVDESDPRSIARRAAHPIMSDTSEEQASASPPSAGARAAELALIFDALATRWQRETGGMSLISARHKHPAWEQILSLGPEVVPEILRRMEHQPDHWHAALVKLTGENPIPVGEKLTGTQVCARWIAWGKARFAR
jgi:hypothetical protein